MNKKLSAGLALAVALGAAWFMFPPEPTVSATRASTARTVVEDDDDASSTSRRTLRRAPAVASAETEPVVTPLQSRARSAVSRATAELHDYLEKNPSRLHEMCLRGATPEEYKAEAARIREVFAHAAGGPVGEVVLQAPDPGCRRTHDDWLSAGLANTLLGSDAASQQAFMTLQGEEMTEDAQRALGAIVASSANEQERIAALVLLKRSDQERFPLPVEAYADIAKKSPQEIQLLLDAHESVPLPPEVVADIRALVTDGGQSIHVRSAALAALGHRGTSSELLELVGMLGRDPNVTPELLAEVGPALARCGLPCVGGVEKLAASTDEGVRSLAYNAGLRAQGEEQAVFRKAIRQAQAFAALDFAEDENDQRRSLDLD